MIIFTKHAENKFAILRHHNCHISREQVMRAIDFPEHIDHSLSTLLIAQISIDDHRVLRVVYRVRGATKIIITFYPGRKKQYEKK